jgi:hypothetical protein
MADVIDRRLDAVARHWFRAKFHLLSQLPAAMARHPARARAESG